MSIDTKVEELKEKVIHISTIVAGAVMTGVALGIVYSSIIATSIGIGATIEAVSPKDEEQVAGRLYHKSRVILAQTKGHLDYGDFLLSDGRYVRLYDNPCILEGKIFANTQMEELEIGNEYALHVMNLNNENTQYLDGSGTIVEAVR
ncbi:MAG: hypothetical protein ABIJ21_03535 [Nanoarchaeota archaeon]